MEWLKVIVEFIVHFDKHLLFVVQNYGSWAYVLLFFIIFAETGFVVTPFLPGDSLLFMVGAIAAMGSLNIFTALLVLSIAAILGDNINYSIGKAIGPKIFKYENSRFFKKENLLMTQRFYQRHGAKTIILARFFPIIRTFAPFVAGVGKMNYPKFLFYNIIGGIVWVAVFVLGGFCLGNIPFIKNNFGLVIFLIIFVSILPIVIKFIMHRLKGRAAAQTLNSGLTIVEAMVSAALIMIILTAAAGTIVNSHVLSSFARHKLQAAYVGQEVLEQQRRTPFSGIINFTAPVILDTMGTYNTTADDFMGNATINVTSNGTDLKNVRVEISWPERILTGGQITIKEYFATTIANDTALK